MALLCCQAAKPMPVEPPKQSLIVLGNNSRHVGVRESSANFKTPSRHVDVITRYYDDDDDDDDDYYCYY